MARMGRGYKRHRLVAHDRNHTFVDGSHAKPEPQPNLKKYRRPRIRVRGYEWVPGEGWQAKQGTAGQGMSPQVEARQEGIK